MELLDFCEKVKCAVNEYVGDSAEICINEITKNNGIKLQGLVVRPKDNNLAPTIYINEMYEQYESGKPFSEIMNSVFACIDGHNKYSIDMEYFTEYEKVKEEIVYKLINYKMNTDLLEQVPYIKWLDFAIVFCHIVEDDVIGRGTILIRNEHLKMWNIECDDLYKQAKINTPRIMGEYFKPIGEVVLEMLMKNGEAPSLDDVQQLIVSGEKQPMYVLSNEHKELGAAALLYSNELVKFADTLNCNIYIIPSSIHEVILVPETSISDSVFMRQMIKDVNESQVCVEERLSDNLYVYNPQDHDIDVVVG